MQWLVKKSFLVWFRGTTYILKIFADQVKSQLFEGNFFPKDKTRHFSTLFKRKCTFSIFFGAKWGHLPNVRGRRSRLNTLHFPSDDFLHPTHAGNGVGGMIIICPDMYLWLCSHVYSYPLLEYSYIVESRQNFLYARKTVHQIRLLIERIQFLSNPWSCYLETGIALTSSVLCNDYIILLVMLIRSRITKPMLNKASKTFYKLWICQKTVYRVNKTLAARRPIRDVRLNSRSMWTISRPIRGRRL